MENHKKDLKEYHYFDKPFSSPEHIINMYLEGFGSYVDESHLPMMLKLKKKYFR